MKAAILGAGAMGSLVGAHLKQGGAEVYFIDVYEEHMKAVAANGLYMELETETAPRTVFVDGAATNGDGVGVCDLVILLVKCMDSETAIEANRALFGKDTVVITLQNGVGGVDLVAKHFDADHIGMGVLKASANLFAPGKIYGSPRFSSSTKGVYFAPLNPDTPYRGVYDELEKLLCAGGMQAECNAHTEEFIWDKLCMNVMFNAIGALLQLANEHSGNHEDGDLLMGELARETCEVANAKGIPLRLDKYWPKKGPRPDSPVLHYTSAVIDAYKKRRTEIDFLNGAVVREGKKYGIPTPYNETIWRLGRLMQDTYDCRYQPRKD